MFGKRPIDLTPDDIRRVCEDRMPETAEIEFKEALSAKGGRDPWKEKRELDNRARNELLKHAVGLANAQGGHLLLGIAENREKPARAATLNPVPDCADLAERLRRAAPACIDPPITILNVVGIPTEKDGSGVVVVALPKSRAAPHRLVADRECYTRRNDSTVKMTMREIQDLTINLERGLGAVDARFRDSRLRFMEQVNSSLAPDGGLGLHVAAYPTASLHVDRVYKNDKVIPPHYMVDPRFGQTRGVPLCRQGIWEAWHPILRGAEAMRGDTLSGAFMNCSVASDGMIEYRVIRRRNNWMDPYADVHPFQGWDVLNYACAALVSAERFRQAAGYPSVEYALDVCIAVRGLRLQLQDMRCVHSLPRISDFPLLEPGDYPFPRYSVGDRSEFSRLSGVIARDLLNAAGSDPSIAPSVNFDPVFAEAE